MEEKKRLLEIRKIIAQKRPYFIRFNPSNLKRIKESWRKPKGGDSKVRKKKKGKPRMPSIGFRSPKKVRGLLRDGTKPILIHNIKDLEKIEKENKKEEVSIIIAATVGKKKRKEIIKKAEEKGMKIINK